MQKANYPYLLYYRKFDTSMARHTVQKVRTCTNLFRKINNYLLNIYLAAFDFKSNIIVVRERARARTHHDNSLRRILLFGKSPQHGSRCGPFSAQKRRTGKEVPGTAFVFLFAHGGKCVEAVVLFGFPADQTEADEVHDNDNTDIDGACGAGADHGAGVIGAVH